MSDSLIRNSTDGLINAGGTLHKVRISGLQPGMKYTYKLHSVELIKLRPYQIYYGDIVDNFETESQLLGPIIDTSVRYFASNVPFGFIRGNHETRGFGFPMLINGNTNYVKVEATPQMLSIRVVSDKDETILSKELQKK
ncbi:MAG: hypothetical protein WC865_12005 [Bacteroidales bacterium]